MHASSLSEISRRFGFWSIHLSLWQIKEPIVEHWREADDDNHDNTRTSRPEPPLLLACSSLTTCTHHRKGRQAEAPRRGERGTRAHAVTRAAGGPGRPGPGAERAPRVGYPLDAIPSGRPASCHAHACGRRPGGKCSARSKTKDRTRKARQSCS